MKASTFTKPNNFLAKCITLCLVQPMTVLLLDFRESAQFRHEAVNLRRHMRSCQFVYNDLYKTPDRESLSGELQVQNVEELERNIYGLKEIFTRDHSLWSNHKNLN